MALFIDVGTCGDDPKKISKNPSWNYSGITCVTFEPCDVFTPVFILDYNPGILQCNYLRIGEWGRYYFIDDVQVNTANRMMIHCTVDPLMSFRDEILNMTCNVVRQQYRDGDSKAKYVVDDQYKYQSGVFVQNYNFADVLFGNGGGVQYLIGVIGGENKGTNYQLVTKKPADWTSNWATYYTRIDGEYVYILGPYTAAYAPDPDDAGAVDFATVQRETGVYEQINV